MDFSNVNWAWVGFPVMAIVAGVFIYFAAKRTWDWPALLIGLVHLPIAFIHAAAPFRGSLDPNYPGYIGGLVHADPGFEVFAFSGFILAGATLCAVIAVRNGRGLALGFVAAYDMLVLLLFATPVVGDLLAGKFADSRIEFGEYLQFGGFSAFLFEFLLVALPFIFGLRWSLKRLNGQQQQEVAA